MTTVRQPSQLKKKPTYWDESFQTLVCQHAEESAANILAGQVTAAEYTKYVQHQHVHKWLSPIQWTDQQQAQPVQHKSDQPSIVNPSGSESTDTARRWKCRLPVAIVCSVTKDTSKKFTLKNINTSYEIPAIRDEYDEWWVTAYGTTKKEAQYRAAIAAMYVLKVTNIVSNLPFNVL